MNHVVSFSTGLSSALTVERVIERYGVNSLYVVFMNTLIEDDDNYRFQREMYTRWQAMGVIRFVELREGRTPYEVAEQKPIIPNQRRAPCTETLKIKPFIRWMASEFDTQPVTVYIGYDFTESHRCGPTRDNYEKRGWRVDFPLLWKPYEFRDYSEVARQDWGIEPPRMYALGYSHANCGGTCVKQGIGDWLRTLINYPERYAEVEQWEAEMRQHPIRKDYAICRDQSNGTVTAKTLYEIRQEYEQSNGGGAQLAMFDSMSPCVHCGVGDFVGGD